MDPKDATQIISTVVTALATVALAAFGLIQIWAERRRRESDERAANARREREERTVDARLSTSAFDLRKGLVDWILKSQATGWREDKLAQEALEYVRNVLDRFDQALIGAAGASPAAAAQMQSAYAHLRAAEVRFEGYLGAYYRTTQQNLRGEAIVQTADDRLLLDAREDFRACCNELERIVEPRLLAEMKRLGAWRGP